MAAHDLLNIVREAIGPDTPDGVVMSVLQAITANRHDVLNHLGIEVNADDEWREIPTDLPKNHNGKSLALFSVIYVPNDDDEWGNDPEDAEVFIDMMVNDLNEERARAAFLYGKDSYRPVEVAGIPMAQFLTSEQLVELVNRLKVPSQPPVTGGGGCTAQKEL